VTSRVIVLPDFAFVLTSNPLSILDLAGSCCRGSRNSRAPIKAKTLVSQWKNTERCHAVPCTAPKPLWVRRNSPVLIAKEVQGNTIEHTCNPQNSSCIQTATFARKISIPPEAGSRGHTSILRAIGHAVKKYTPSASPPRGRPKQRTVLVVRRDHLDDRDLAARSNMLSVEVGTAIMRARVELGRCWSTAFHALCLPMQSSSEGRSTMKDVIVALSRTNGSCDRFRASGRLYSHLTKIMLTRPAPWGAIASLARFQSLAVTTSEVFSGGNSSIATPPARKLASWCCKPRSNSS